MTSRVISLPLDFTLWGMVVGDVDNDGRNEVIHSCGLARWDPQRVTLAPIQVRYHPLKGRLADYDDWLDYMDWFHWGRGWIADTDHDGRNELIYQYYYTNDIETWVGDRKWRRNTFTRRRTLVDSAGENTFAVADVDGDGKKEIVVGYRPVGMAEQYRYVKDFFYSLYRWNGDEYEQVWQSANAGMVMWDREQGNYLPAGSPVSAADIDQDGCDEVLALGTDLWLLKWKGSNLTPVQVVIPRAPGTVIEDACFGDIDNDRVPELIVSLASKEGTSDDGAKEIAIFRRNATPGQEGSPSQPSRQ